MASRIPSLNLPAHGEQPLPSEPTSAEGLQADLGRSQVQINLPEDPLFLDN